MPGPLYGPDFEPGTNPTQGSGFDWGNFFTELLGGLSQAGQYGGQQQPGYWGDPGAVSPSMDPRVLGQQQQMPMQFPMMNQVQLLFDEIFRRQQMEQNMGLEEEEEDLNPAEEASESQRRNDELLAMLSRGGLGGGM
jgi:hypothetical protein